MSAPRIILASLLSFCQKLPKLVEVWQNCDKKKFAQFFSETRCKNCHWQRWSAINCLSSGINILAGGSSVPFISERKGTDPHWKRVRSTHFAS